MTVFEIVVVVFMVFSSFLFLLFGVLLFLNGKMHAKNIEMWEDFIDGKPLK